MLHQCQSNTPRSTPYPHRASPNVTGIKGPNKTIVPLPLLAQPCHKRMSQTVFLHAVGTNANTTKAAEPKNFFHAFIEGKVFRRFGERGIEN